MAPKSDFFIIIFISEVFDKHEMRSSGTQN